MKTGYQKIDLVFEVLSFIRSDLETQPSKKLTSVTFWEPFYLEVK